ncbi:DUF6308 family protein [Arthrobacter sp. NEB 688]|uniref:DUF6308 family protein n=1 Tax=Arthrobacter sp. NEB 688 TaxID=904039 RepID=UPI0015649B45|nr:DUF6308 family protein [Arthrobacter sp. NEB 688]QKE85163.1 hypothetical protein HL663_15280 [Arthrobacter sp. NEB 688]
MDNRLEVGGVTLDRPEALASAQTYLRGVGGYGYPAYDGYCAGGDSDRLSDGDLLAPGLLNVPVKLDAFYELQGVRTEIERRLRPLPLDLGLQDAGEGTIEALGNLFALVDDGIPGVRGTIFAKIVHRKRPALVPLYDKFVWRTYVEAPGSTIKRSRSRSWREFVPLLAAEMRRDLRRDPDFFDAVVQSSGTAVSITRLRALDIVAWQAGKQVHSLKHPTVAVD